MRDTNSKLKNWIAKNDSLKDAIKKAIEIGDDKKVVELELKLKQEFERQVKEYNMFDTCFSVVKRKDIPSDRNRVTVFI